MEHLSYSVLMSVYYKEKPEYLKQSIESMLNQTVKTDDFVLVCDGPLTSELDEVLHEYVHALHLVRLKQNCGLGNALNEGLKHCKHELVARMDSDDISIENRCEKELNTFKKRPEVAIVSGTILEFQHTPKIIEGKRMLPERQEEICEFSRKRSPFNHPAVMFKKSAVAAAGGYKETYKLFEDYYLWVRMLQNNEIGINLTEPLLYMRTPPDMFLRRGGKSYAKNMLQFHRWMRDIGWTTNSQYMFGAIPHALICILPNKIRKRIYSLLHNQ